jgi:hypothetical protein
MITNRFVTMSNATADHVVDVDTHGEVVTVVAMVVSVVVVELVVVDAASGAPGVVVVVVEVVVVVVVDSSVVRGVSLMRGIEVVGTGASFGQNCELKPHS